MNDRAEGQAGKGVSRRWWAKDTTHCFSYMNSFSFEQYPDRTQAESLLLCKSAT